MSILPVLAARVVMTKLLRAGFVHTVTKGSHYIFRHPVTGRTTSVPFHSKRGIGRSLLKKILQQAGISVNMFLKM